MPLLGGIGENADLQDEPVPLQIIGCLQTDDLHWQRGRTMQRGRGKHRQSHATTYTQILRPSTLKKRLPRQSESTSHSLATTASFQPYGQKKLIEESTYSSIVRFIQQNWHKLVLTMIQICSYCLQGGHIATCLACGRGICYSRDALVGCISFDHIDISSFRCPECCPVNQLPVRI